MIANRDTLFRMEPIAGMVPDKHMEHGVSSGMSEAGYDIRIAQTVEFRPVHLGRETHMIVVVSGEKEDEHGAIHPYKTKEQGRFTIASAMEYFQMPTNLVGIVHDKSTWARRGLSVFNTVIEPGWEGYLTLELVYHGQEGLVIPAGAGIAQVVFHLTTNEASYDGRYQHQPPEPVPAKSSTP